LTHSGGLWKAKTLVAFDFSRGYLPTAGLVRNESGALYGTTAQGGGKHKSGTVFQLTQSEGKWTESVIHAFGGPKDGKGPTCDLTLVKSTGELFGTTTDGGAYGYGTAFKLTRSKDIWIETTLYSFCAQANCDDGRLPIAGLHRDSTGVLYGTTYFGGSHGAGTVFELTPSNGTWSETTLYNFGNGGSDGYYPDGLLVEDASGALYGTTSSGGTHGYYGTVFKLSPLGESVLWSFGGSGDGVDPNAGLYMDSTGVLYGTTAGGGRYGYGIVFKLVASGGNWKESVLHNFGGGEDGREPFGALIEDTNGHLYGTTLSGGEYGYGTVFGLTP
jgi:uncharacterized repeat protein (TIGR03803 family)